jgi:hypothetical protein
MFFQIFPQSFSFILVVVFCGHFCKDCWLIKWIYDFVVFYISGLWLCQRNVAILFIDTNFLLGIIWTVRLFKTGPLGSCPVGPVTIYPLMSPNISENKNVRCFFLFYNTHFSFKSYWQTKYNIPFWSWIYPLVIFGCRLSLSMIFEGENKKSSSISSLTVHMSAFVKPLWAFVVATAFLYAVETISLRVSFSSAFLEKRRNSHHGIIPLARKITTYLRFYVVRWLRW